MIELIAQLYQHLHLSVMDSLIAAEASMLLVLFVLSLSLNWVFKRYIAYWVRSLSSRSPSRKLALLRKHNAFERLSQLGPALLIYALLLNGALATPSAPWTQTFSHVFETVLIVYMLAIGLRFLLTFADVTQEYLRELPYFARHPLRSYVQIVKVILWLCALVLFASVILNQSPWGFFTGLGALSAVLLLVFKDTIVGFVANVQVAAYDIVREGDWIAIPSYNAEGTVLEVLTHTVKIKNADNSIVSVPSYALVSTGIQNSRPMSEAGVRRIKRAISIDMETICFCSEALLTELSQLKQLKAYIADKTAKKEPLTNIGLFREYIERYLREHPCIHQEMPFLIRQLEPSEKGLPIEIYVFTKGADWIYYEGVQSDLFDHFLAILPRFHLRAFQLMSGHFESR